MVDRPLSFDDIPLVLTVEELMPILSIGRNTALVSLKNDRWRRITPADFVMGLLRRQRNRQAEWRLRAGPAWEDNGLVFTNELGKHLSPYTVYKNYKRLVASIGCPEARFHDLRHPNVKPKTKVFYPFFE